MHYFNKWRELVRVNPFLNVLDIFLKGYGQVLLCLNPLTGLFLCVTIFYLSKEIWLLTFIGLVSATLTARLINARKLHLNAGVYGFNGVVFGVVWLWFFNFNIPSIFLLAVCASLSSLIMKVLTNISSKTKFNPPILSVPFLVIMWLVISYSFLFPEYILGPSQQIINYSTHMNHSFYILTNNPTLAFYLEVFKKHIIAWIIIFAAIMLHSRISVLFALISVPITLVMVSLLEGIDALAWYEFYIYNCLPCSLALGGSFLVFNRKSFIYAIVGLILVNFINFIFHKFFPSVLILVAPFNLVTIVFICLAKTRFLNKHNISAVPLDFVSTPEAGIEWSKAERYADDYWRDIKKIITT